MLKFIQALFNARRTVTEHRQRVFYLTNELTKAKNEAEYWKLKYENAKKWIDDIKDGIHSYEDGE
ncbi:hypothetical protein DCC39_10205 [Pueribacillus theae]|uniref:Uncharacterized protein n=1 Tax=Pueribacillus theae TaxID=2171751 RepID=A0A2U1K0Y4_9BACI|nr:hypothetical protein [Pueribacillus theae]PWA11062.1 hypothetical protein DCC39_10205 [Pueribacillus theae]